MSPAIRAFSRIAPVAAVVLAGCVSQPPNELAHEHTYHPPVEDDPTKGIAEKPGATVGGEDNTFDHMADLSATGGKDPFEILAQREEEGPPEVRTRLHSCQKLQYGTLRNLLVGFGVDMDKTSDPPSAGQLFKKGSGALGAASYDARASEDIVWSAAGAAKLFDIFVQAAPEIIANLPSAPQCQVNGSGPEMFDAAGHCNAEAVTCLIGRPATEDHVAVCDSVVANATDTDKGKIIAVATLLSAAHSCE
jgi:hypothetical protein